MRASRTAQIRIGRIRSEDIESEGPERLLSGYDGILVPGGFGERGIEGKVIAIRYARTKGIPFLGLCLGMQCAVIEFGRNVCNLAGAHSTEFDKNSPHPVICLLDAQKTITDKGGTMRLARSQRAWSRGALRRLVTGNRRFLSGIGIGTSLITGIANNIARMECSFPGQVRMARSWR